jgi:SAM-dependent methyltransferase
VTKTMFALGTVTDASEGTPSTPKCPLCRQSRVAFHARARDIEYQTLDEWFDFYRCTRCQILFIEPMLADHLELIYPPNYYSFVDAPKTVTARIKEWIDRQTFQRALRSVAGDSLSALDVGGGTGWLLDIIRQADSRVTNTCVIDIDPEAETAARRAGHDYFLGRIEDFPEQEKFDVILMLNLIEHVADPRAVLQKTRQLLAPNGRIFIKTPNFEAMDARIFRNQSWGGYHTPRHFVLFTHDSFAQLCEECGLNLAGFSYTQGAPFWSVSVLDWLRRMGFVRITRQHPAIYHALTPWLQMGFAAIDFLRRPVSKLSQMQFVLKHSDQPTVACESSITQSATR